jgi:hypothetical protein
VSGPRALVAELSVPISNAVKRFLEQSGYQVAVGFGSLMREASLNLRLAQESGGNRIETTPLAMAPRRDRVSLA